MSFLRQEDELYESVQWHDFWEEKLATIHELCEDLGKEVNT